MQEMQTSIKPPICLPAKILIRSNTIWSCEWQALRQGVGGQEPTTLVIQPHSITSHRELARVPVSGCLLPD